MSISTTTRDDDLHLIIARNDTRQLIQYFSNDSDNRKTSLHAALVQTIALGRLNVFHHLVHLCGGPHIFDTLFVIDDANTTLFHRVCMLGLCDFVSMLLTFGASESVKNDKGLTPQQVSTEEVQSVWMVWNKGGVSALQEAHYPVFVKDHPPSHVLYQKFSEPITTQGNNSITVAQFNVLADWLSDAFPHADKRILRWEFRKHLLISVIASRNPDVFALEECDQYSYFLPNLEKEGYDGTWISKPHSVDGTAIFWRKQMFIKSQGRYQKYGDNNQGLYMIHLEHVNKPGSGICFAATHLKAKVGFEAVRKQQGDILLATVAEFNKELNWPTLIVGDFNDEPHSPVISNMLSKYTSAYDLTIPNQWTTWKKRETEVKRTIDYIFYDPTRFLLKGVLLCPNDDDCPACLPADYYPSDHLLIAAQFYYKSAL